MGLDWRNGCRLGCTTILFASCSSFQNNLPRIPFPSPGLRWRVSKITSPKSERPCAKSPRRSVRNLFPLDPSSTSYFPINMSNGTSSDSYHDAININGDENKFFLENKTNNIKIEENNNNNYIEKKRVSYTLDISKHYFEEMEGRSGKDYRWIKPLTKPVSHVMMYVAWFASFVHCVGTK